jgi:GTP-binding protein
MQTMYKALFNPEALNNAALQQAGRIFAGQPQFIMSAKTVKALPPALPRREVAVVGRSNVGKSSILNALMASDIVKTSALPGFTKTINLFHVGTRLSLVDLPGYGFNSNEHQMQMIGSYLTTREGLTNTCVLIESSHGIKEIDSYAIDLLEQNQVPYQV